ncbi:RNA polymerase sigma factor [Streptomyces iconiensis]|uniref:RNA polymerase sigma factor n=1 Tax=Streptomyces iconiensis TaxID=1384038 RepID=A0ABT7A320_9ACTN|nr:RNA polymerase sigma factor [Streptomyces iconiensis]MDJ1135715.1 RNA polymerase sigma factor [Streptomyces iconiensis]
MPLIPERAAAVRPPASRAAPPRPDAAGFALFYEENFDAVLGFVTRRTACPQVAADLTADIFVAALEAAGQYDAKRGAPAAWLYGIARNVLSAHYRGSVREQHAVARLNGRRLLDEEDIAALDERIDAERAARELTERHAELIEPLRAVLDLVAVDGLSPREAAQALGLNTTTVRVRLHRARRALRTAHPPVADRTDPTAPTTSAVRAERTLEVVS